jgi:prefoldin subunit 5
MNDNIRSLETLIGNLETEIDELQQEATQVEADARAEYRRRIDDLRNQKYEAQQRLAELETSSKSVVEEIKSGIQQAWNDIKETVNDAAANFK